MPSLSRGRRSHRRARKRRRSSAGTRAPGVLPFLVLATYGLFDQRLLGYHHYGSRTTRDGAHLRHHDTEPLLRPSWGHWGSAVHQRFPLIRGCGNGLARDGGIAALARLISLASPGGALRLPAADVRLTAQAPSPISPTAILGAMPVCAWSCAPCRPEPVHVLSCWRGSARWPGGRGAQGGPACIVGRLRGRPPLESLRRLRGPPGGGPSGAQARTAPWRPATLVASALAMLRGPLVRPRVRVAPTLATAALVP